MAIWTKEGGCYVAELGPGFPLAVTREGGAYAAEVFGKQLKGEHATVELAQGAAEQRARELLTGALAALDATS